MDGCVAIWKFHLQHLEIIVQKLSEVEYQFPLFNTIYPKARESEKLGANHQDPVKHTEFCVDVEAETHQKDLSWEP